MFNRHPEAPERAVVHFVVGAQFTAARLFAAQTALRVLLGKSLIAAIGDDPDGGLQMRILRSE